jgi:hypothetical protein
MISERPFVSAGIQCGQGKVQVPHACSHAVQEGMVDPARMEKRKDKR